mmetsp:Transcript_94015/g.275165  ORF Transcript_94015/g.275165 Transcript_94015/m.275165 type:complete len:369 (-) Transcript_94015:70-1176(-)
MHSCYAGQTTETCTASRSGRYQQDPPHGLVLGREHSSDVAEHALRAFELPLLESLPPAALDGRGELPGAGAALRRPQGLPRGLPPLCHREGTPRGRQLAALGHAALALGDGRADGGHRVAARGRVQALLRQALGRGLDGGGLHAEALGLPDALLQLRNGTALLSRHECGTSQAPPDIGQDGLVGRQLLLLQARGPAGGEGRLEVARLAAALRSLEAGPRGLLLLLHGQEFPRLAELRPRELRLVPLHDGGPQALDLPAPHRLVQPLERGYAELFFRQRCLRTADLQEAEAHSFALAACRSQLLEVTPALGLLDPLARASLPRLHREGLPGLRLPRLELGPAWRLAEEREQLLELHAPRDCGRHGCLKL